MPEANPTSKLWWAVPAAGFLLLVSLAMIFGGPPEPHEHGTSYDASSRGFRAAYLLLEGLNYPVVRSKQPSGEAVRWVLFPQGEQKDTSLAEWVRGGGMLLVATDSEPFARQLGMRLQIRKTDDEAEEVASGLGDVRLAVGGVQVQWAGEPGTVLVKVGDEPVVTVHSLGRGQVWLVNRPELLSNRLLRKADNAVLVCQLATAMLEERPGRLAFDEYVHGLRDRPSVTQLLFRPPTVWVTVHGLLLLGVLLWHYASRFGAIRPPPPPSRRSKEEFLNALASLLERKKDYAAAFATARDSFARELEQALGLPPGAPPEQVARLAAQRRPIAEGRLLRLLTGEALPSGAGGRAFVQALNELETARHDFFSGRSDR